MKSTVLITGATGYLGSKLAMKLAEQNHQVHVLCRSKTKAESLKHPGIKVFKGDLLDKESLNRAMEGCEFVYHLASYARVWAKSSKIYYQINVQGTINVLEAARRFEVKKVVVTSTASIFGPSGKGELTEDCIRTQGFFNDYETSKYMMEEKILHFVKNGLDVVMVHPTRVYGPGEDSPANAVSKLVDKYIKGQWRILPGDGSMVGNYAFVDDVVDGHILAMARGRSGEKYILGGPNLSYQQFFKELGRISGKNRRMFQISKFWMILFARIQTAMAYLLNRPPLITPNWVRKFYHSCQLSTRKAEKQLGYCVTPIDKGLRATVKWLQGEEETPELYTLVTGASSGIGRAIAEKFARQNANLVLVSLPDTGLPEISRDLENKYQVKAQFLEIDLTLDNAPETVFRFCQQQELKVNYLINNAGMGHQGPFEETSLQFYETMMRLNVVSMVKLSQLFIPELKKQKNSHIINVSSLVALFPVPYKCVYAATKSFVLSFSGALREELKSTNVKVSCLCPGFVPTSAMVRARITTGSWLQKKLSKVFMMSADSLASRVYQDFITGKGLIITAWHSWLIYFVSRLVPLENRPYFAGKFFKKG